MKKLILLFCITSILISGCAQEISLDKPTEQHETNVEEAIKDAQKEGQSEDDQNMDSAENKSQKELSLEEALAEIPKDAEFVDKVPEEIEQIVESLREGYKECTVITSLNLPTNGKLLYDEDNNEYVEVIAEEYTNTSEVRAKLAETYTESEVSYYLDEISDRSSIYKDIDDKLCVIIASGITQAYPELSEIVAVQYYSEDSLRIYVISQEYVCYGETILYEKENGVWKIAAVGK